MDVHRCRFVDYTPSAINALAFSHSSGKHSHNQPLRLAVGRANGNIEIWDPRKGVWIHEITLYGGQGRSVDGLAWVQDPDQVDDTGFVTRGRLRLFSIGNSSTITEWDLINGLPLRESTGSHSEVWCLAAQPTAKRARKDKGVRQADSSEDQEETQGLVAGCADGSLVLFSTANDGLDFVRSFPRIGKKKARALSVTFQSRNVVVAGFSDTSIRVFDIRKGRVLRDIAVEASARGGPKETLVWAVQCLKDGTIVAGDSNGQVTFWDAKIYGQLQRIKAHEADILCLAVSYDGQTVLSGGMDRRTCMYGLTSASATPKPRWTKLSHRRLHRHDVKAMACFENSKMSIVVSGGLDTAPVLLPLRTFDTENSRQLPFIPQQPPLIGSKRMVVNWHNNEVKIWSVDTRDLTVPTEIQDTEPKYSFLAAMSLADEENITSASLDVSGRLLAVSTVASTKLFELDSSTGIMSIRKLAMPSTIPSTGARICQISPDSKWLLLVGSNKDVQLCRITYGSDESISLVPALLKLHRPERLDEKPVQNCLNGTWGFYNRIIVRAAFSADSRILAVADLSGHIDTWLLEGHEDATAPTIDETPPAKPEASGTADDEPDDDDDDDNSNASRIVIFGQRWVPNPHGSLIPQLPSTPLIFSFRPQSPDTRLASPQANGNPAVHPTRHNPHAHSRSLPTCPPCEDRLFIMTASHNMFEFNILSGRLSAWSRAKSTTVAPERFKLQRDRAIGCVWDVGRERIWIYSASWLAMFDLRYDATDSANQSSTDIVLRADTATNGVSRKRRRSSAGVNGAHDFGYDLSAARSKAKLDAKKGAKGPAGSLKRTDELGGSIARRKIRKLTVDGTAQELPNGVRKGASLAQSHDEDDEDASSDEAGDVSEDDGDDDDDDERQMGQNDADTAVVVRTNGRHASPDEAQPDSQDTAREGSTSFYMTLRYRQILGVVPLASTAGEDAGLEVALVERPLRDLDLGPRFVGRQEWDRGSP